MTINPAEVAPVEDVNRGTVVALLTVPAGVIVWVLIWSVGFILSAVTYGVALLAMFLYTRGSGGAIGRVGAVRVTIITLATVVLSIFAGIVSDVALAISRVANISPIEALNVPQFNSVLTNYLTDGEAVGSWLPSVLIGIAFAILGCYGILRNAFRATATPKAMPWPAQPEVPEAEQKP